MLKKKPLTPPPLPDQKESPAAIKNSEESPTSAPLVSTPPETLPVNEPFTPPIATPKEKPLKHTLSPKKKAEFSLGQDLLAVQKLIEQEQETSPEEEKELSVVEPIFREDISIDYEKFLQTLHTYVQQLQAQNRMNQAVALTEAAHKLKGNAWSCTVNNDLSQKLISHDKELLPYMRGQLDTPELFIEISISESVPSQHPQNPYTPEEKLKAMAEKNPTLKKLMELFNARIIYK